jgi:uncharacterized membrane protein YuzA (DUF378 family)
MGYILKGLVFGTKKFWFFTVVLAVWVLALFDLFASIRGLGFFNGKLFNITVGLTAVGFLYFLFHKYFKEKSTLEKIKAVEEHAALFESKREEEIRKLYEENPEFTTHCYECIHFDPDKQYCSRKLSDDITQQRVKEVRIGNRQFCLYWERSDSQ